MSAYSTISTYPSLLALWDRKARNQLLGSVPWSWTIACRRASFSLRLSSLGSELSSRRDNGDSVYDSSSCHLFFHWPLTGTFTCEHLYSSKIETDPLGNFQKSLNVRLMFTSSLSLPREMLRIGFLPYWLCWHWASWRALASFTAMNFPTGLMQLFSCLPEVQESLNCFIDFSQWILVHKLLLNQLNHKI